ncbi:GNAT family N-acetyltransferase [Chloroflexota bacterium]
MDREIKYREIHDGEEKIACQLVMEVFDEFIAPGYTEEGINEFSKAADPDFMRYRLANNRFILVAFDEDVLTGVIEVRNNNHISLFFVRKEYMGKGIGKTLNKLAIDKCLESNPSLTQIDVNSSPYAVPIYEKLGFVIVDLEQTVNGIRYNPMALTLD